GSPPRTVYAVGGGTKNAVWTQATSDISGLDQVIRARTIGASYGDAFLAAVAVGDAKKSDIAEWNPVEQTVSARGEHAAVYRRQYRVFRDIYEQTRDLMAELSRPIQTM